MDDDSLLLLLSQTLSKDNIIRRQAEVSLSSLSLNNNDSVIEKLSKILVNNNSNIESDLQLIILTYIKNNINKSNTTNINSLCENLINYFLSFQNSNPFIGNDQILIKMIIKILENLINIQNIQFQYNLIKIINDNLNDNEIHNSLSKFYIIILLIYVLTKSNRFMENSVNNQLLNEISSFTPLLSNFLQNYQSNDIKFNKITYIIMKILNNLSDSKSFTMFNYFNDLENLQLICETIGQIGQINNNLNDLRLNKWILKIFINLSNNQLIDENIKIQNLSNTLKYLDNENDFNLWILEKNCRFGYYFFNYLQKSIKLGLYSLIQPYIDIIISNLIVSINLPNDELIDDINDNINDFMNYVTNDYNNYTYEISIDLNDSSKRFLNTLITNDISIINPLIELCEKLINSSNNFYYIVCGLKILNMFWSKIKNTDVEIQLINKIIEINSSINNRNDLLWVRCIIYNFFTEIKGINVNFNNFNIDLNYNNDDNEKNDIVSKSLIIISIRMILLCNEQIKQQDLINPIQIMQILLKFNENENLEIINDLIDLLIERYIDELGPYSYELICNLNDMFLQIINNTDIEQDNEIINKLLGILNNILTIIISINDESIISVINDKLKSLIEGILENASLDYLEIILEICDEINNKCRKVYNLSTIIESFEQYGWEYYEFYENYLHNIYYFGDKNDKEQMNLLIKWIINENSNDEEFQKFLIELIIEKILSNECDDYEFEQILEFIYNNQSDDEDFLFKKINIELILIGIYKKSNITLKLINNEINNLINNLQNLINNNEWNESLYDLKIGLVGLIGLYKINPIETIMELIKQLYSELSDTIENYNNGEDDKYWKSLIDTIDILELVKGI